MTQAHDTEHRRSGTRVPWNRRRELYRMDGPLLGRGPTAPGHAAAPNLWACLEFSDVGDLTVPHL